MDRYVIPRRLDDPELIGLWTLDEFAGIIVPFTWGILSQHILIGIGMAFGAWFAGALYDHFGYYAPAFGISVLFNIANLLIVGFLVFRIGGLRRSPLWPVVS